jgi:hypothetical protein
MIDLQPWTSDRRALVEAERAEAGRAPVAVL